MSRLKRVGAALAIGLVLGGMLGGFSALGKQRPDQAGWAFLTAGLAYGIYLLLRPHLQE